MTDKRCEVCGHSDGDYRIYSEKSTKATVIEALVTGAVMIAVFGTVFWLKGG